MHRNGSILPNVYQISKKTLGENARYTNHYRCREKRLGKRRERTIGTHKVLFASKQKRQFLVNAMQIQALCRLRLDRHEMLSQEQTWNEIKDAYMV